MCSRIYLLCQVFRDGLLQELRLAQGSLLICHSPSQLLCAGTGLGQAQQPRALLVEGCLTACPGASREREELRGKEG